MANTAIIVFCLLECKQLLAWRHKMASCQYSEFVGGPCGPSLEKISFNQRRTIGECDKNVRGHLTHYKVWDTKEKLLLARAGIYNLITCTIRNHAQFAQTCCSTTIRLSYLRCSAKLLKAAGGGGSLSRDLNFVRFQMVE